MVAAALLQMGNDLFRIAIKCAGLLLAYYLLCWAYSCALSGYARFDPATKKRLLASEKYELQKRLVAVNSNLLELRFGQEPHRRRGHFTWSPWKCLILVLLVGMSFVLISHEQRLQGLEAWKVEVDQFITSTKVTLADVNHKIDSVALTLKESYGKLLQDQNALVLSVDNTMMWATQKVAELAARLQLIDEKLCDGPYLRSLLGLGCFPAGTMIQINKAGEAVPIESLRKGQKIWNPDLQKEVPLAFTVVGNETGTLFVFTTTGGLSVNVTETHPMKVLVPPFGWANVAAKNVPQRALVETVNGIQQVHSITKLSVVDILVYNMEYALGADVPLNQRSVVANGVQTLDFVLSLLNIFFFSFRISFFERRGRCAFQCLHET